MLRCDGHACPRPGVERETHSMYKEFAAEVVVWIVQVVVILGLAILVTA